MAGAPGRHLARALRRTGDVTTGEPERLAEAAARLGLRHVVITSVTRDDLDDGGADHHQLVTIRLQLLGHQLGEAGERALPHLRAGDADHDGVVRADHHPGIDLGRAVGGAHHVGQPGTGVPEGATVSIDLFGRVTVRVGFALEGQGQYTVISQVLADYFGVAMEDVAVVPQDTLSAPPHFGPGGSRLGVAITGACLGAAQRLRDKLVRVAAVLLQCDAAVVELMDGKLRIPSVPGAERSLGSPSAP